MNSEQNYRSWRQADPGYNQEEAWPASLFPGADFHYFKECGCLVTSLAIMLRHYGIETETDESRFNPWILNQRLIKAGAFTRYANLQIKRIDRLYPLDYIGPIPYSREAVVSASQEGSPFLVAVPGVRGERHFIVPDYLTEDDLAIIDCAWHKKYLSAFDRIMEIRLFR